MSIWSDNPYIYSTFVCKYFYTILVFVILLLYWYITQ